MSGQEVLALGVVALAGGSLANRFFRGVVAGPLAERLLRQGRVKWAMRLRGRADPGAGGGCGDCGGGKAAPAGTTKSGCH